MLAGVGGLAGNALDALPERFLARLGDLVFVLVACGELLQFLVDLPRDILLLDAERYRLRVVGAEIVRDFPLALADGEIARPQVTDHRIVTLLEEMVAFLTAFSGPWSTIDLYWL